MAVSVSVPPILISAAVLSNETPVTATGETVTVHVAVLLPLTVVTVMVALPTPTPVTFPFASTVATEVLLLLHVTLSAVPSGKKVGVSVSPLPFISASVSGRLTLSGGVIPWICTHTCL